MQFKQQRERKVPHNDQKDKYLSIDCEMVGVGPNGRRSALARVSIVDWDLELVFDTYVQVMDRVTDYRTHISGIRKKHLKGAMNFRKCRERVQELLRGKIVVGHGLENDFDALRYMHPEEMIRDTSQYKPLQRLDCGRWKARKLRDLVRQHIGNKDFQQGEHDSIHDARAVMELYHMYHIKWEENLKTTKIE
jgi:RNA exonuclease 4